MFKTADCRPRRRRRGQTAAHAAQLQRALPAAKPARGRLAPPPAGLRPHACYAPPATIAGARAARLKASGEHKDGLPGALRPPGGRGRPRGEAPAMAAASSSCDTASTAACLTRPPPRARRRRGAAASEARSSLFSLFSLSLSLRTCFNQSHSWRLRLIDVCARGCSRAPGDCGVWRAFRSATAPRARWQVIPPHAQRPQRSKGNARSGVRHFCPPPSFGAEISAGGVRKLSGDPAPGRQCTMLLTLCACILINSLLMCPGRGLGAGGGPQRTPLAERLAASPHPGV